MADLFIDLAALFLFLLYLDVYIYFPFSLFVSVSLYASLCDFCLYNFSFTICPRVLSDLFFFLLLIFLFLIFFLFFILITLFYYFSFFLSFFLPFLLTCVADRVLMLRKGVRPVPLRWESQVQDMGPPETSQLHVISKSKSSHRDLHLDTKTQLHSKASKLQCWTPYAKQLARQEHNPTHQQRGCLKS